MLVIAVVALSGLPISAEEFPLTFKAIPAGEIAAFPGGPGAYGSVRTGKPAEVKKEPRASSKRPLYLDARQPTTSGSVHPLLRVDESGGDGKGYDQLVVDVNQNGDLTDDPVLPRITLAGRSSDSASRQEMLFGPFEAPGQKAIAGNKPVLFAQVYLYNLAALRAGTVRESSALTIGQVRFRPGWYLEATVTIDGVKQVVGIYDANGNCQLGDIPKSVSNRNSSTSEENFYFLGADAFLVDDNGSGKFEGNLAQTETRPFGPMLYVGATPCGAKVDSGCRTLSLEKWAEPLAEVTIQPRGDQVRRLLLAREAPAGKWHLMSPVVIDGKMKVPPGNYRLNACTLMGSDSAGEQVMAAGTQRVARNPVSFAAGRANTMRCGGPLELVVKAEKRKPAAYERSEDAEPRNDSGFVVSINATVQGMDKEIYSTYAKGRELSGKPPRPSFTVADARGQKVGSGNLEFG